MDELITKYSEIIKGIYDKRTAGDYTFSGILLHFKMELDRLETSEPTPVPEPQPVPDPLTAGGPDLDASGDPSFPEQTTP